MELREACTKVVHPWLLGHDQAYHHVEDASSIDQGMEYVGISPNSFDPRHPAPPVMFQTGKSWWNVMGQITPNTCRGLQTPDQEESNVIMLSPPSLCLCYYQLSHEKDSFTA
ncbi:hypothetical protein CLAIMM_06909 [Cladophialophora immunda]|nr:hypothetical protein CLAIMM_06909 [Cladophialophora immunda]